jgi:hypothetical protein
MPRFRFSWSNIEPSLLAAVVRHLNLRGDNPAEELRVAYGARPRENFVEDSWPVLLNSWLSNDTNAREAIAASLRERGVGNREVTDDTGYLGSCRNTIGLRRVVLPVFIAMGEIARDGLGSVPAPHSGETSPFGGKQRLGEASPPSADAPTDKNTDPGDPPRSSGTTQSPVPDDSANQVDHLRNWVRDTLRSAFDDPDLEPDDEGDLSVPYGSIVTFLTVNDEPLRVEIYAVLLRDIQYSEQLMKTLNTINTRLHFEKVVHIPEAGVIVLSTQLSALGISQRSLMEHVRMVAVASDFFDTQLHEQFGGVQIGEDRKKDEQIV